jgi:hypothetical protein
MFLTWLVLILRTSFVHAQNTNYFGFFPTIDHSAQFTNRLSYSLYLFDAIKPYNHTENGIRDEARSFFIYGEAGVSYDINPKLSITASYVHKLG